MAIGTPVVSTRKGRTRPRHETLAQVLRLLSEPELGASQKEPLTALVRERYDWEEYRCHAGARARSRVMAPKGTRAESRLGGDRVAACGRGNRGAARFHFATESVTEASR